MRFRSVRLSALALALSAAGTVGHGAPARAETVPPSAPETGWRKLATEPYRGKQDAIDFVDRKTGWYGNGLGRVFRTEDGGETWTKLFDQPGTYVRAIAFVDAQHGFFGNIGTDYFPGVTDTRPLYETFEGGASWKAVEIASGPAVKGICAIDILSIPFINAGHLDHKVTIRAAGRVGGPAFMMTSRDGGKRWTSEDLSAVTAMILDVKFLDEKVGFIAGATNASIDASHALILRTIDGGKTWAKVYESARPWETTWKLAFPSRSVGYVTVQNYNPEAVSHRVVAKTTDGGASWREITLGEDAKLQEFGVGFVSPTMGWVGTMKSGMETRDGGRTWAPVDIGVAANKFKVLNDASGASVFTVGVDVYRWRAQTGPSK